MKTTNMEKKVITQSRTSSDARRVRVMGRRDAQSTLLAAADRQIAEIERTFSLRYEW